jgi:hypothetical protein
MKNIHSPVRPIAAAGLAINIAACRVDRLRREDCASPDLVGGEICTGLLPSPDRISDQACGVKRA